jgi:hypothetical protein
MAVLGEREWTHENRIKASEKGCGGEEGGMAALQAGKFLFLNLEEYAKKSKTPPLLQRSAHPKPNQRRKTKGKVRLNNMIKLISTFL